MGKELIGVGGNGKRGRESNCVVYTHEKPKFTTTEKPFADCGGTYLNS